VQNVDPSGNIAIFADVLSSILFINTRVEADLSRIRVGFTESAKSGGQALYQLGKTVEQGADMLIERYSSKDGVKKNFIEKGLLGRNYIDTMARIGDELVYIESKYQLPESGEKLKRLSEQLGNLITSPNREKGSSIYVFSAKILDPEIAEKRISIIRSQVATKLLNAAGKAGGSVAEAAQIAQEVNKVKFLIGYRALAQELSYLVALL
jgi:hypothetical protein